MGLPCTISTTSPDASVPAARVLQRLLGEGPSAAHLGRVLVGQDPELVEPRVYSHGGAVEFAHRAETRTGREGIG